MKRVPFFHRAFLLLAIFAAVASAQFRYQVVATPPIDVAPGGTINFPNTQVNNTTAVTVRVTNATTAAQTLTTVSVIGSLSGFNLSQAPNLPLTLSAGASTIVTASFTPPRAGDFTGGLSINSDTMLLAGTGILGQALTFSYQTSGTTIPITSTNNSVIFTPAPISASSQVTFTITNSGSVTSLVSNIGIGQTPSPFSLLGTPTLPLFLTAGASASFTIVATPTALGFTNGTLNIDSNVIPLVASGLAPPALPAYTITGASGTVAPKTQPKISLTLGAAYPVALSGVLTLTIAGTQPADPAVQFSTGGRTVPFTIPAKTTSAIFGPVGATVGSSIGFQTGTVAGTITATPTFATQVGSVDLTPASPTTLQLTVAPAAPVLLGIQLTNLTTNGFSISATGYTTSRTLTTFNVEFVMASGFSMPQTKFAVDLQQAANIWFQSATSLTFGSQFTVTVPFTFQGSFPSNQTIQNAISSLSVSVVNDLGTSNTAQAKIQ